MTSASAPAASPCGILLIDKDKGPTSMQVCASIRARLRRGGAPKRVRVGHAGTLDPLATGLLIVMVGRATRLCESLMRADKEYEAEINLSRRSTTDDAEGEVTVAQVARPPDEAAIRAACRAMVGDIMQRPPAFSAVHVGGRRAYQLARQGAPPDLPARPVRVDAIEILARDWPMLRLRVTCGKGVYVRSLARDIGALLGVGGMLTALRRTRIGPYRVDDARRLASLAPALSESDLLPAPAAT